MNLDTAILDALKILAILALVLVNGFFVAAEFAFVRIRETQLDMLVAKGSRRAKTAQHIVRNLNSYLSATQLGITMASLGLGYLGEPVFTTLLKPLLATFGTMSEILQHSISFVVGFTVLTFLSIVVGELGPKWLTIQNTQPVALAAAHPLRWFYLAFYPFNKLLNLSARGLLKLTGFKPDAEINRLHSEEELRLVLASAQGAAGGRTIALNALDLHRRTVREIMRPRQEISAFGATMTMAECVAQAEKTRYSRFPICENGDLDKMLGVVHIKDLYPALRDDKARTAMDLVFAARKLIYVPETCRLEKLLQLFLERKLHFAVVVDEYGGTLGIATLENALETLVGQIQDEFDSEKSELAKIGENVWEAAGSLSLHDLEKIAGKLPRDEDITTVSGWVTKQLGGFPKAGDVVTIGACELRVREMAGPLVTLLKITKRDSPEQNQE